MPQNTVYGVDVFASCSVGSRFPPCRLLVCLSVRARGGGARRAMLADLEALDWPADLDKETSAKLYEACAAEWKADMQSGFVRNVQEASEPVEAESLPASRSLQSVSATLTAEEARWRAGGAALEQHWLQEAQAMFERWRAEDSARLNAALRQAANATVSAARRPRL